MSTYDVIIVGAGPGGYRAAEQAGALGMSVLLIEKADMGGVCTNWGCIPTKSLLNSAKLYAHARDSEAQGVTSKDVKFDLPTAMQWKQETVETLRSGISYLMKKNKVEVVHGEAEFVEPTTVKVGTEQYTGKHLIIATGSSSAVPPIKGADRKEVMTSRDLLAIDHIPKKLVVIGGGVIGIEFSSLFNTIGSEVTVLEMMDEILPIMDKEFAKLMRRELKGITFKTGCKVEEIGDDGVVYTDSKGKKATVAADVVLLSVGRRPNTEGLEHIGLSVGRSGVEVDQYMRTNLPNVYAVGDVNGKSLLAHSAERMGEVAINHIAGKRDQMRYEAIPWAVYSLPEAAGCGLTAEEAEQKGIKVKTASVQMRANGRFLAEHGKRAGGLCKVVAEEESGRILGVHLLGAVSSELIYGAAAFIEAELRVQDIQEIIFPHPSVAEVIRDVCREL
ncbi:MAG: dihydrolipoyl dehydrogenase [Spirochaetota bacterium]